VSALVAGHQVHAPPPAAADGAGGQVTDGIGDEAADGPGVGEAGGPGVEAVPPQDATTTATTRTRTRILGTSRCRSLVAERLKRNPLGSKLVRVACGPRDGPPITRAHGRTDCRLMVASPPPTILTDSWTVSAPVPSPRPVDSRSRCLRPPVADVSRRCSQPPRTPSPRPAHPPPWGGFRPTGIGRRRASHQGSAR